MTTGGMASHKQRYLDARVEGAQTASEYQDWYIEHPEAFVAGAQYALDKMLASLEHKGLIDASNLEHILALEILEKAKQGDPR